MRYKVKGLEIRSENAAKPISQASKHLLNWINSMDTVDIALDYGCGKLRYSGALAKRCNMLTLVDSTIQINRKQVIDGIRTTVRDYTKDNWRHSRVLSIEEYFRDKETYNFVLCANTLSTIPSRKIRSKVLKSILSRLSHEGFCLFTTQFRNSYFKVP